MTKVLTSALVLVAMIVTSTMVISAADKNNSSIPLSPVRVALAVEQMMSPVAWLPGTVISRNDARLAAEVSGRITWVAEIGTNIKKGEPVVRMDDTLIRQESIEQDAVVEREKARLVFAQREMKRLKKLASKSNAAQSRLDEAEAESHVTQSNLRAAEARAKQMRDRLQRMVILAPFDSVVTERFLTNGEWADSGKTVVRVVDTQQLEVQARVPGSNLEFVAEGSEVELRSFNTFAKGIVRAIVPVGDDRSRLYEMRIDPGEVNWPAGTTVRVAVPVSNERLVTAVPRDALVLRRSGITLFRIRTDNTAERLMVITGIASGDLIEVKGDVKTGDRVVIRGGERLKQGEKVRIITSGQEE
ncbi:MAG: efflux RND transporter periplasmic adaptor subunit [Gammaproteobacteria bacterium]|nr:efflux RND transporter periplasmic adaptor subunit [Gammaproteobacteria bacterium]